MDTILPPSSGSGSLDFSNSAIANDFNSEGVSLPSGDPNAYLNAFSTPSNATNYGTGTNQYGFTTPPTTTAGTAATGSGASTGAASSSSCSGIDPICWFGALVGRAGIVVLGLLMVGLAIWMLADKAGIAPSVTVKA